jgi:ATP-binding cassette subfamily B protein
MPILLVLLGMYSFKLTMVVLIFSALIAGCMALMLPIFKHHLDQLYQVEGARQGHMVETIVGMRTIKSLVLGPARLQEWDLKVAQSMRRLMTVGRVGALGNTFTNFLEKVMQLAILGVGAQSVFDGDLSIGSLVAFNMLSGRVSGPLIAMVSLINEYQQVSLSIGMLGTVMDHPPEREPGQRYIYPKINGEIEFEEVSFRYSPQANPALDRVSFRIEPGQMIGIVGRSGSGKSTITRLIQGIHNPDSGLLKVSGADIRHIDLNHLRRSIGIVLQDNFLFKGTIRENISATKTEASMDEIIEASRMAGAAEFIDRLPNSYGTVVQENASNFSGGQRQRIAIARALLPRPLLMIFDEATSALDPESEAIVQENLDKIAEGRTMIVVSHRLSSLVKADAILVLEQGSVVDFAPHNVLVERCEIYRHLWETQTRHIS